MSRWKRELKNNGELQGRKLQHRGHLRKITPERIEDFLQKFLRRQSAGLAEYLGARLQKRENAHVVFLPLYSRTLIVLRIRVEHKRVPKEQ